MKKLLAITILSLFGATAMMAQYASNGYRGNNNRGNSGINAPRGGNQMHSPRGNRGAVRGNARGPNRNVRPGNARGGHINNGRYGYNRGARVNYNRGVMPRGCSQTRVVYRACDTPGWRWNITEGYFWVDGFYTYDNCGRAIWNPGYYEWRVITRDRVRYGASCGW